MPDSSSANLTPAPPEFYERLQRLIATYPQHFAHLHQARFEILLRETNKGEQTVQAWGEADTPDNTAEAREFDFTIWFAADTWGMLDEYERDSLAFHELCHCRWDDNGLPTLVDHDMEVFIPEIRERGFWWQEGIQELFEALWVMPPPHAAEKEKSMPVHSGHQRPRQGSFGSGGAGRHGSRWAGRTGSTGAGSFGSGGARVAWSDPGIQEGGDFFTVPVGNGEVIELCPECFAIAYESMSGDVLAMAFGDMPEQGSFGSGGV